MTEAIIDTDPMHTMHRKEANRKIFNTLYSTLDNYTIIRKTSLHLLSAVSADITSGITSDITSAVGPKPEDFLFLCFSIYILRPGLS